uniref:Uncharacterized protein n=1 Tax=Solanum tuberosum TaxID=4113 RepID=M1ADK8_SOLTU
MRKSLAFLREKNLVSRQERAKDDKFPFLSTEFHEKESTLKDKNHYLCCLI